MIELLQRVMRTVRREEPPLDYEASKHLAASPKPADRRVVARHSKARPELLYYLTGDADREVRASVAANESTPVQADLILARDRDERVRIDLAEKIARLTPTLSDEEHARLRDMTYEVLEILVRDQVTRVREVIATVLKDVANAPPHVIRMLARDSEIVVARPVLQFSPVLTDADLLEIIGNAPISGALTAIAHRASVASSIADAIGASPDEEAITALLENPSAQIREETLDRLVDRAPKVAAWHRPLVARPWLPGTVAKKLAHFVAQNLLQLLTDRKDLDPETAHEVKAAVLKRIEAGSAGEPAAHAPAKAAGKTNVSDALARAQALKAAGTLDEATVLAALGNDRTFVRAALAALGGLPLEVIDRVLSAHSPKGVTALAWHCHLSMHAAVKMQIQLGQISPAAALRPSGGRYPLTEEAMRWQLEFFGGVLTPAAR
ncbi:MAG TPA: DUF2336 domain-containing protein [Stellaceae bacterium]|nr:DUF2336 domain-containing protein [Stellaceae bacterium]